MRERIVYLWNHIAFFFSTGKKKQALGELLDFQQDLIWDAKLAKRAIKATKSDLKDQRRLEHKLSVSRDVEEHRALRAKLQEAQRFLEGAQFWFTKSGEAEFLQRRWEI